MLVTVAGFARSASAGPGDRGGARARLGAATAGKSQPDDSGSSIEVPKDPHAPRPSLWAVQPGEYARFGRMSKGESDECCCRLRGGGQDPGRGFRAGVVASPLGVA